MNYFTKLSQTLSITTCAATALVLSSCGTSNEQTSNSDTGFNPSQVQFVAPSSPGGSTDLITRSLAQNLEEPLGATVSTVNQSGANGAIGTKDVVRGEADGKSLALVPGTLMAVTPLAVEDSDPLQFDEMQVLAGLTVEDYVLVVNANENSAENATQLLEQEGLSYGTAGVGTGGQLSQALLLGEAEVEYTNVPMDGGADSVNSLLGGHIDAASMSIAEAAPHIEEGSFRPILTFGNERPDFLDDVPTAQEEGFDISVSQKRFVATAEGVDNEVVETYQQAISDATASDEYQEFLEDNYISEWTVEADEVASDLEQDAAQYESSLEDLGIELQG